MGPFLNRHEKYGILLGWFLLISGACLLIGVAVGEPTATDQPSSVASPFTPGEMESLRALLSRKDCILEAAEGMKRIKAGELTVTLPPEKEESE